MFDKKMAMLYILDIMKEYSDENHLLTHKDIINKLNNIHHVELERKTVATNLDLLAEYGYDINKGPTGGFYLGERDLDETEIKFLIDAVYSSKLITGKQATAISKKIDTYETSILPYEDCCTVFLPKHPTTKPKLDRILESESKLDCEQLIADAIAAKEVVYIKPE